VLPFEVLGDHPEQRYLADGLAADLATDLSRSSELAAVRLDPDAGVPGAHADAAFRIRGAVQRAADRIAVEVRLEDAATGRVLWSERYYRAFGDLFEIRDDIEARVVQALPGRISAARGFLDAHRYSRSVDAYDAFLKARAALLVRTEEGNEQAEALYLEAVELDAAFARAYGGLALIHAANFRNQWTAEGEAELRRAMEMARTAVRIDPQLPEAHWALGYVSAQRREHHAALVHLDKALAVAPAYADALALKGGIYTDIGQPRSSIPLLREAIRLKPLAGYLYYLMLGRAYFFLGDFEQAAINLREATARDPANLESRVYLAATLQRGGDSTGAEWEAEEVRTLDPAFATGQWLTTYPMTDPGQRETLASALAQLGL
jgi:TolB-like protein